MNVFDLIWNFNFIERASESKPVGAVYQGGGFPVPVCPVFLRHTAPMKRFYDPKLVTSQKRLSGLLKKVETFWVVGAHTSDPLADGEGSLPFLRKRVESASIFCRLGFKLQLRALLISINQSIKFNSGSLAHVKRRHTHEKNNNKTLHYTIHYYYYSTTLHYQWITMFTD